MKLADWYRVNGETEHVEAVEDALDREWRDTNEVTERAGKSRGYTTQVLLYLMEEGRAERQHAPLEQPIFAQQWKWVWRRRNSRALPGEPTLE